MLIIIDWIVAIVIAVYVGAIIVIMRANMSEKQIK